MTPSQQAFVNFLSLWAHTHSRPVTCATLLPLAEACGVELGAADAPRGRQSNLGRLLNSVADGIGGWRIVVGTRTENGAVYSVEQYQAVSEEVAGAESG